MQIVLNLNSERRHHIVSSPVCVVILSSDFWPGNRKSPVCMSPPPDFAPKIRYPYPSTMTLLDAQTYDFAKARRRKITIAITIVGVLVLAGLAWMYRNWPEEHTVDKFFAALQQKDYENAYGIYFNDPTWRDHRKSISNTPTQIFIAIGDQAASGV